MKSRGSSDKTTAVQISAYQTTGVVVVQFHQRLDVTALAIRGVHEVPRLLESELHVVAATAPLPVTLGRQALLHLDSTGQLVQPIACAIRVVREIRH